MTYLIVGDLHLTDRPRDNYRFSIFEWVKQQQIKFTPRATFFLGDLTDKKDNHSATLVNRIADELDKLEKPVYILKGNHDYTDPDNPFFDFLNFMDGVKFVSNPAVVCRSSQTPVALMPHCRSEKAFRADCKAFAEMDPKPALLLCHNTFDGAIAETGVRLSGFSQSAIDYLQPQLGTYAGDVHRPQRAANVIYVGSPYHIRFGDGFNARCILLNDDGSGKNLHYNTTRKWTLTVRDADELNNDHRLVKGDQVKLTVELAREEAVQWHTFKQEVREAALARGLEVFGLDCKINSNTPKLKAQKHQARTPSAVYESFCEAENVSSVIKGVGQCLLLDQ